MWHLQLKSKKMISRWKTWTWTSPNSLRLGHKLAQWGLGTWRWKTWTWLGKVQIYYNLGTENLDLNSGLAHWRLGVRTYTWKVLVSDSTQTTTNLLKLEDINLDLGLGHRTLDLDLTLTNPPWTLAQTCTLRTLSWTEVLHMKNLVLNNSHFT